MKYIIVLFLLTSIWTSCKKQGSAPQALKVNIVSPANGSIIGPNTDVIFSWSVATTGTGSPGSAGSAGSTGSVKIKIVEIVGDQSPDVALRTNKPIFEKDSCCLLISQLPYPSKAARFVSGASYSWSITVKKKLENSEESGESPVSIFTVSK